MPSAGTDRLRLPCGSGSSGHSARSPNRRCARSPTSPAPSWSPYRTVPDVLDAVERRRSRSRFRADRELDRGHGQLHAGRARLRPRPADPARGRARHPALPAGAPGRPRSPTSRSILSIPVATAPVPSVPPRVPARRRGARRQHHRRAPRSSSAKTRRRTGRDRTARSPPSATGSRCSPRTSRTTGRNQTRFVLVAPDGHPGADRPRPHGARGVPARRRAGQPDLDPAGVRRPPPSTCRT